jgi:F-type H+-transporting ATPase subunit a
MAESVHGQTGAEGRGDAMSHAADYALFGIDAQGAFRTGSEMYRHGSAVAGYAPRAFGPFKLEFTRHMLDMTVVAVLLGAVLVSVGRRVLRETHLDQPPRGPLANAVEALLLFIRDDIVVPTAGRHLSAYTPLYLTYFFFILIMNLTGMIPLVFKGPTANLSVTAALAASVFVFLTFLGLWRQGPVKFFVNLVPHGMPWVLWPFILVLEYAGSVIRCCVLAIRLFANMLAGHLIGPNILALGVIQKGAVGVGILGLLFGMPLALGIALLDVLVCLIQAYVFTMLSVIFTNAAVHPEH